MSRKPQSTEQTRHITCIFCNLCGSFDITILRCESEYSTLIECISCRKQSLISNIGFSTVTCNSNQISEFEANIQFHKKSENVIPIWKLKSASKHAEPSLINETTRKLQQTILHIVQNSICTVHVLPGVVEIAPADDVSLANIATCCTVHRGYITKKIQDFLQEHNAFSKILIQNTSAKHILSKNIALSETN